MDLSLDRVLDASAITNGLAVALAVLAKWTAVMPKGLDDRLTLLLNTCFTRRVALLRDFVAAYASKRAGEFKDDDAAARTDEFVESYVSDADRHSDNRMVILRLLRMDQVTGPLVVIGAVLAAGGGFTAFVWARGQPVMIAMGTVGLLSEVLAVLVAHYVEYRYKGLRQGAEFQGR